MTDKFALALLKQNPLLEARMKSGRVGLVVFAGRVGSGTHTAAMVAVGLHAQAGGISLNVKDKALAMSSQQWAAATRIDASLIYLGDVKDGEGWLRAFELASRGFGVIACTHAPEAEHVLPTIRLFLEHSSLHADMESEERTRVIQKLLDFHTTKSPFLMVHLGESMQPGMVLSDAPEAH